MWRFTWYKTISFLPLGVMVLVCQARGTLACSTCYQADAESMGAYYGTTILLSLVPLALAAGLGYWIYRSFSK